MSRNKQVPLDLENIDETSSYSITQVARAFGYTPNYVRRLIKQGRLTAFKPNSFEWRVRGKEVARLAYNLDHHGGPGPKPDPLERVPRQDIHVSEEQMKRMDPAWQPPKPEEPEPPEKEEEKPEVPPARKGFTGTLNEDMDEYWKRFN